MVEKKEGENTDQKPTTSGIDSIILNKKEIKVGSVLANMFVICLGFLQYGKLIKLLKLLYLPNILMT